MPLPDILLVINSNLGRISHHYQDTANFLLENTHFSYNPHPIHLIHNLKMFPLE